ncbi:MAG: hypothetical protein QCI82_01425 [Candidatus Thermoplasmatota archaeon]|nr:hypothetical protein [Candidatus Thermoplasmatota archaeon]
MDILSLTVELAFVASLIGFLILTIMIPSRKAIEEGRGGRKIGSAIVPILMVFGSITALSTIPMSILTSDSWVRIAGLVTGPLLVISYLLIFVEYRRRKRQLSTIEEPVVAEVISPQNPVPDSTAVPGMTVECPRCRGHLVIRPGSTSITCPHCGMSGSL